MGFDFCKLGKLVVSVPYLLEACVNGIAVLFPIVGHRCGSYYEHPLVAPHVSHFSQVPFLTMVKLPHSVQELPV